MRRELGRNTKTGPGSSTVSFYDFYNGISAEGLIEVMDVFFGLIKITGRRKTNALINMFNKHNMMRPGYSDSMKYLQGA